MANYKRGKCRKTCPRAIRGSQASWRAKHALTPVRINYDDYWPRTEAWSRLWPVHVSMMSSYPAWWDRSMHTPQFRAKTKQKLGAIMKGVDPDSVVMPVWGRPHKYYW